MIENVSDDVKRQGFPVHGDQRPHDGAAEGQHQARRRQRTEGTV